MMCDNSHFAIGAVYEFLRGQTNCWPLCKTLPLFIYFKQDQILKELNNLNTGKFYK